MPVASRRRLATHAGVQAAGLSFVLSVAGWFALRWGGIEVALPLFLGVTGVATAVAGLLTAFYVELSVGRRIGRVVRVLDAHARKSSLQRLPNLGDDEIGEIGRAVNDLLANLTSLEVRMIEQGQELRHTREELVLKKALGLKSAELEQRLRERALLFDIVRASASEQKLDSVLGDIAMRLGKALQLRECMLFLVDTETRRLTLRAAYGFENPGELLERIVLFDEDALGKVAQLGVSEGTDWNRGFYAAVTDTFDFYNSGLPWPDRELGSFVSGGMHPRTWAYLEEFGDGTELEVDSARDALEGVSLFIAHEHWHEYGPTPGDYGFPYRQGADSVPPDP